MSNKANETSINFSNNFVKKIKPYSLASHTIWEVKDQNGILKLDWNEATIAPTPKVKEVIVELAKNMESRYYPDVKNTRLLRAIADYCEIDSDYVQYFPSSDSAHECIAKVFLNVNDHVLMLSPTYDNFRLVCEVSGAIVKHCLYDEEHKFNFSVLNESILSHSPKLVYLCNPNNPTGTFIEPCDIKELLVFHPSVLFIIDEAYFEFSKKSAVSLVSNNNNIIITRTFSKAFALANFRIGYIVSGKHNIEQLNIVRNPKNISTFSQEAAIAALSDIPYTMNYVDEVIAAKEFFSLKINELNIPIENIYNRDGNFILLDFSSLKDKLTFISLLEEYNIFVRNLSHAESLINSVRITVGTRKQMEFVISILERFYE